MFKYVIANIFSLFSNPEMAHWYDNIPILGHILVQIFRILAEMTHILRRYIICPFFSGSYDFRSIRRWCHLILLFANGWPGTCHFSHLSFCEPATAEVSTHCGLMMPYGVIEFTSSTLIDHQWGLLAFNKQQFHRECSRYLFMIWV